jgi:hypothetical protein
MYMPQMIKKFLWGGGLMMFSLQSALGFALLGPLPGYSLNGIQNTNDAWQVINLGYNLNYYGTITPGGPVWLGDIGGPKNYMEEYRRNVPVLYYAFDDNFSGVSGGWFGTAGEDAVDQAFAIMNSLTNVDNIDLSQFPFQSQSFNYTAQGLYLTDLKSVTLHLLVEQMGLTEPERYTWTLHDRNNQLSVTCPLGMIYLVAQRNLDLTPSTLNQVQYSPYVNNVLYTYFIEDDCDVHGPDWTAITVPHAQDPMAQFYTAVAANNYEGRLYAPAIDSSTTNTLVYNGGLAIGGFYTGLTRDDVGGLKYLMRTNNVNFEAPAVGSQLIGSTTIGVTNLGPSSLLFTSNYTAFALTAQFTDPATLSNLFPGLVIVNSSYTFSNVITPNIVSYTTNLIGAPAGSQVIIITTNGSTSTLTTNYTYTFANLVVSNRTPNTIASLVRYTILPQIGAPAGSPLVTNITKKTIILTNVPSGEYFINTNYLCGPPRFLSMLAATVTATTNLLYAASNSVGEFISASLVIYSTSHVYVVQQPICSTTSTGGALTNSPGYFQGIGRVRFVRVPNGQMISSTHILNPPITTNYTMILFNPANNQWEMRTFQRVVTTPDIIFSAADLARGPAASPFVGTVTRSIPNYEDASPSSGLAGPGVIDGQTIFTFNKVGPIFWNGPFPDTNGYMDLVNETTQTPALQWASFDGTTNAPILYANGASIEDLENRMVITISPTSLPDGTNGVAYPTTTFSATGGHPPYSWALATGTNSLPAGLTFPTPTDDPTTNAPGVFSGTPTGESDPGIYDFAITVTDSSGPPPYSPGRTVTLNYTITIH